MPTQEPAPNIPDRELALAIRASDHVAFKTLYYRYYEPLFRFLWRRVGSEDTALDLLQDLFTRVWSTRQRLDPEQSTKAYLYRIGHNLVIDYLRHSSRKVEYLDDNPGDEPAVPPDEGFDIRDRVRAAIDGLPEPQRSVFTMNRFEGIKYAEIAQALGISIKTVESRMSKALKILRDQLQGLLIALLLWLTSSGG